MASNFNSAATNKSSAPVVPPRPKASSMMDSLFAAESAVNFIVEKVAHIQHMKELEKKIKPYMVQYTTLQGLWSLKVLNIAADPRRDNEYCSGAWRDEDEAEPQSLPKDNMQPVLGLRQAPPAIVVHSLQGFRVSSNLSVTSDAFSKGRSSFKPNSKQRKMLT